MSLITLDQASLIATAAVQEGRRRGFQPLCVIVLDAGGHPLALLRDERASIGRPDIARAKAAGCLAMGFGGREIARRAQSMGGFYSALNVVFPHGLLPAAGGMLVRDGDGMVIGAVGVTGDNSDNDEICGLAGLAAAGLAADTGG